MCNPNVQGAEKIEFLKFSISYIENRIKLVDTKANILLAIQIGLLGVLTWFMENLLFSEKALPVPSWGYVLVFLSIIFNVYIVLLLLQTLRPTKYLFSKNTVVKDHDTKTWTMWPQENEIFNKQEFSKRISDLTPNIILGEYENSLFAIRQLVGKKYFYYRYAVLVTKAEIIVISLGLGTFLLTR